MPHCAQSTLLRVCAKYPTPSSCVGKRGSFSPLLALTLLDMQYNYSRKSQPQLVQAGPHCPIPTATKLCLGARTQVHRRPCGLGLPHLCLHRRRLLPPASSWRQRASSVRHLLFTSESSDAPPRPRQGSCAAVPASRGAGLRLRLLLLVPVLARAADQRALPVPPIPGAAAPVAMRGVSVSDGLLLRIACCGKASSCSPSESSMRIAPC